jgi:hypothetical protein
LLQGTPLKSGGIALGGGWNPVEYDHVQVRNANRREFPQGSILYNFQDLSEAASMDGWLTVHNSQYGSQPTDSSFMYGFDRETFTMKSDDPTGDSLYDSAVGIHLDHTKFLQDLPNGDYLVSLQMGWNSERVQSVVSFQNEELASFNKIVDAGDSIVMKKSVTVTNGQLEIKFFRTYGFASYINWLAIVRREDVSDDEWNKYLTTPEDQPTDARPSISRRRFNYNGITVPSLSKGRSVHSLNGDWLFLPLQEVPGGTRPWLPQTDDTTW